MCKPVSLSSPKGRQWCAMVRLTYIGGVVVGEWCSDADPHGGVVVGEWCAMVRLTYMEEWLLVSGALW